MVKLKGKIRIEFHHTETGEKTKPDYEQENLIFDNTYALFLGSSPNNILAPTTIFARVAIVVSSTTTPPSAETPLITNVLSTGIDPAGVSTPIWYESSIPNFGEIQNQISAPTNTPRTFHTVGLRRITGSVSTDLTATLLTVPCTQELFEVLTIFYRIEVSNSSGERMSPRFTRDFGGAIFGRKNSRPDILGTSYANPPLDTYIDARQNPVLLPNPGASGQRAWTTGANINSHYKRKQSTTFQIQQSGAPGATDEFIGVIFNSMLVGRSNTIAPSSTFVAGADIENTNSCYRISRYNPRTINIDPLKPVFQPPFQKIWTHRASAPLPFFDVNNTALGSSFPMTGGTWTGKWPEIYRYTITSNTGDYRFAKRNHLGFNDNTYSDRSDICPFRNISTPAAEGMHGWRVEDNDLLRWSDTQIVQYDATGVTLLDLMNGDYTNWDATTTPILNVTALRQCAVDTANGLIYCACRDTGLWVIDVANNTATQQVPTACYGVDVGRNNVAWGIFEGFLRNSTNWTTNLTFTFTGLTDGFWNRALFLKADPENVGDRLAIVITSPSTPANNRRVVWYEGSTATTSSGLDSANVRQWAASLDVSDAGGFWAISGLRLNFGLATTAAIATPPNQTITHSVWGSQALYKIAFFNNFLIATSSIANSSNVSQNTFTSLGNTATILHMKGGIVIGTNFVRQCFTDNIYIWEEYGWDGSGWVLNNPNPRPTHTTNEPLIQGLTIRWEAGAIAPLFQSGDFFTQGICDGTWKDNGTTVFVENFWYTKAVHFDVAIAPTVIPASAPFELPFPDAANPLFLRVETDSVNELNRFTIDGVDVPTIYINGESPAPGEVTIEGVGSLSKAIFNSADAGKSWAGFYSWIEN